MKLDQGGAAARAWLKAQRSAGTGPARPVFALNLLGTLLGIGQAFCAAAVLADPVSGRLGQAGARLFGFAALAIMRAVTGYLAERAAFNAGAAARRRLRTDSLTRLLNAGPAILREWHSGDLAAMVVDRVEAVDGLFSRWLPASWFAIGGPVLVGLAVLLVDPVAAGALAGCGLLVPVAMALAGLGAAAASRRQFLALSRLQARFLDRIRGIGTIVLHGQAENEARGLAAAADELRRRAMRVLRVAFLSSAALDLATAAAFVMLAIRYAVALPSQQSGPLLATALFVLLLVPEFFAPLRIFAAGYQDRLHATGASEALISLPPLPAPAPPRAVRTVAAQGVTVAFENIGLTWDPRRGPALDGLSFRVPAGETLILAGPSGAGKSTVIEILLGFVRPDRGRVTINGADITDLVPQAHARLIAWIGQRPVLFAGSIRDNIRFARPEATEAEIEDAARSAHVTEFVAALPAGLDTQVGEGGHGLSGGQAQRVAIARAFLKNAPLLLLDEPTAHLDPATEADVLESLRRLALGRTVVLASHSTAAHAFSGRRIDLRSGRAERDKGAA
ncbi:MAG: thiol reductant ABC exporter subunit CydD [Acetobacteraceae bacterium]|nr:thiol reductant ABC exporter subunit CydD [Acetobacteraceae bacterium]